MMKSYAVSRIIQAETFDLKPGIVLVHAQWTYPPHEHFCSIMTVDHFNKVRPNKPGDFKNTLFRRPGNPKEDYRLRYFLFHKDHLETFIQTGRLDFDIEWRGKSWGDQPGENYELVTFCIYDHHLADLDLQPIPRVQTAYLVSENGWDIRRLRKHPGLNILDDSYCPGNGDTLTIGYMPGSPEEMIEFAKVSWEREQLVIKKLGLEGYQTRNP